MTDWTTPEDVPATTVEHLHRWLLHEGNPADAATTGERAVADIIRAFWPVPAPTLAEELRDTARWWRDGAPTWEQCCDRFDTLADRAEQMEHDLAEARAEVERLTAENEDLRRNRPNGHDPFLILPCTHTVQKGAESSAETPNPADVKEEEPYHIYYGVYGNDHTIGVRIDGKWRCIGDDRGVHVTDTNIARLHRLVPAPRVITNTDELERLAATSIIRDGRGWPGGVTDQGVTMINGFCVSDEEVLSHGPATVLWEPEA